MAEDTKPETESGGAPKSRARSASAPAQPGAEPGRIPPPAATETAEDTQERALAERTRTYWLKERELELKDQEDKQAAKRAALEKEARDDRAAILKAVKASVPDLTKRLVDKMDELSVADHEFARKADATLMQLSGVKLKEPQEFFDLNPAQREDLLDRVGVYRGVTIDHRLSNPVQVGFRDILRRPPRDEPAIGLGPAPVPRAETSQPATAAARILYRRPGFAGYFENFFTSSEAVHQSQKNGVTNLKFSLSVAGGVTVRAGVGAAMASSEQSQFNDGSVKKKVYITSNFFLPRIELSFDDRKPCASQDFVDACREAVESSRDARARFLALRKVLDAFGHFAATQTLIGGRLFATETKDYEGAETASNVTKRFAAEVKASLNAPTVNAEAGASVERSNQAIASDKSRAEAQVSTFHAVGGEGGLVQNAAAWVESLFDYRRWSAVQRENLIPSINLLPADLRADCWSVLETYAASRTKRDLLFEDDAYFAFYGEYGERVGARAGETWFVIKSGAWLTALTLSDGKPAENGMVGLTEARAVEAQIWRMTPDGQIVSRLSREPGAYGRRAPTEFALTVVGASPGGRRDATGQVVLRQLGRAQHQAWEYTGAGELVSQTFGENYVLAADGSGQVAVRARSEASDANQSWDLVEITGAAQTAVTAGPAAAAEDYESWFKLRVDESGMVLSVSGAEARGTIPAEERPAVVVMPDIGGAHQLWRRTENGQLVSRIAGSSYGRTEELLLSLLPGEAALTVMPANSGARQRWKVTAEAYLAPATGSAQLVATVEETGVPALPGAAVRMLDRRQDRRQTWTLENLGRYPVISLLHELTGPVGDLVDGDVMDSVDGDVRRIDGVITGVRFRWWDRGLGMGWGMTYDVQVRKDDASGPEWLRFAQAPPGGPPKPPTERDTKNVSACPEPKLLYLPEGPIADLKLDYKPGTRNVTFMYREKRDGPWLYPAGTNTVEAAGDLTAMRISHGERTVNAAERIVAIGAFYRPGGGAYGPRLLVGPRPGFRPAGSMIAPGDALASPNRAWELRFDDARRVVVRSPTGAGGETVLWSPPPDTPPGASWRLLVGAEKLHLIDAATAGAASLAAAARSSRNVLAMQDDGNLVIYEVGGEQTAIIAALKQSGARPVLQVDAALEA